MTALSALNVCDVSSHASAGHCVNHGAPVAEGRSVLDRIFVGREVCARPVEAAPANRSEQSRILQAFRFVFIQLGGHSFLRVFSNLCLCDWLVVGSKNVMTAEKKEAG